MKFQLLNAIFFAKIVALASLRLNKFAYFNIVEYFSKFYDHLFNLGCV